MQGHFAKQEVGFLGRGELIRNKLSTGRLRDLADLEALGVNPIDL